MFKVDEERIREKKTEKGKTHFCLRKARTHSRKCDSQQIQCFLLKIQMVILFTQGQLLILEAQKKWVSEHWVIIYNLREWKVKPGNLRDSKTLILTSNICLYVILLPKPSRV